MINQTIKVYVKKTKTLQYNVALAITDAIKYTSQIKLDNEFGLNLCSLDGGSENCVCF